MELEWRTHRKAHTSCLGSSCRGGAEWPSRWWLRREAQIRRVQLGYWLLFIGLVAAMLIVIVQGG